MKLEAILKTFTSRIGVVKVVNALNPLLWLTAAVTPISLLAAVLIGDPTARLAALGVAALPVLTTAIGYFLLLFRDPDRLQSEEYQLKQLEIRLWRKGEDEPIMMGDQERAQSIEALPERDRGSKN